MRGIQVQSIVPVQLQKPLIVNSTCPLSMSSSPAQGPGSIAPINLLSIFITSQNTPSPANKLSPSYTSSPPNTPSPANTPSVVNTSSSADEQRLKESEGTATSRAIICDYVGSLISSFCQ